MEEKRKKMKEAMEQRLVNLDSLLSAMPPTIKADLRELNVKSVKAAEVEIERLQIKLKLKEEKVKTDEEKYNLLDKEDEELTSSQLRKKRM